MRDMGIVESGIKMKSSVIRRKRGRPTVVQGVSALSRRSSRENKWRSPVGGVAGAHGDMVAIR